MLGIAITCKRNCSMDVGSLVFRVTSRGEHKLENYLYSDFVK